MTAIIRSSSASTEAETVEQSGGQGGEVDGGRARVGMNQLGTDMREQGISSMIRCQTSDD